MSEAFFEKADVGAVLFSLKLNFFHQFVGTVPGLFDVFCLSSDS